MRLTVRCDNDAQSHTWELRKGAMIMRKRFSRRGFRLVTSLVSWLSFGLLFLLAPLPSLVAVEEAEGAVDLRTAIVEVAKKNIPAVAHIEVTARQEVVVPSSPFENDPFFRFFFDLPQRPKKFKRELKGLGTGMIIDREGHILTNNHVVAGATEIQVLLDNGKQYRAKLVGTDPKTDLAVIKISASEPLPHVTFGDSDKAEVGEWVVAIGHPRGLDQTVTQGIISAKHRRGILDPSTYQDFLQTDAAINPGNSGGPLLNLEGEVIGVNAAIASASGGSEGIGFAIPSNMALHIAKTLIVRGKVERGWFGGRGQNLTPELARSFGLESTKGVLVSEVVKGGPAEKGGLRRGDVIIAYQGRPIEDATQLQNEIASTPVGQEVKLTIIRKGQRQELKIQIVSPQEAGKTLASALKDRLGINARSLSARETERYSLSPQQGVLITSVEPQGPLGEAGLEVGDILLEINGQAIENWEGFVSMVRSLPRNQQVTFLALDHRTGNTGHAQVVVR
jgi:serine protease Do